jgi:hypothetical protein
MFEASETANHARFTFRDQRSVEDACNPRRFGRSFAGDLARYRRLFIRACAGGRKTQIHLHLSNDLNELLSLLVTLEIKFKPPFRTIHNQLAFLKKAADLHVKGEGYPTTKEILQGLPAERRYKRVEATLNSQNLPYMRAIVFLKESCQGFDSFGR